MSTPLDSDEGIGAEDRLKTATESNRKAWNAIADWWDQKQTNVGGTDDGNDMFTQCLLPQVEQLADYQDGETVLDLGAGSGIICRRFARKGAKVAGVDNSLLMLDKARKRSACDGLVIDYDAVDLMSLKSMQDYAKRHPCGFDIITISTTMKSLPSLDALATALPLLLKRGGRVVCVDLHPAFSKPAGHRGMEIFEDPNTGKQQLQTYIKVMRYLDIPPSQSEAVRGQPAPLTVYHRPFWSLLEPFFRAGLVMDAMREPAFQTEGGDPEHAQSYHNFPQTPMLLAFRLKHGA